MKVGFVGCGKMGEAILADLLRSGKAAAANVAVCEADPERRGGLRRRHGVATYAEYGPAVTGTDVVFLAVKPQSLDAVLRDVASVAGRHGGLYVSIAAGKRLPRIEALLPGARVVRVMPNLATLVSEGMSVFCAGTRVAAADRSLVVDLLSSFGGVLELPERQFDAVTAVSGSGPAFLAYFLKLVIEAATDLGLNRQDAGMLAVRTMTGAAKLLSAGGFDVDGLIAAVSSPHGTTVAGMAVLERSPMADIVRQTLRAAAQRSQELSR